MDKRRVEIQPHKEENSTMNMYGVQMIESRPVYGKKVGEELVDELNDNYG